MNVDELIRLRRSVRRYRPDPVPRHLLEEVLELAQWAPSAMNRQPWHFVVVGGEPRERLSQECAESFGPLEPRLRESFPDRPQLIEAVRAFFCTLGGAPVVVLAYCTAKPVRESDIQSVAAAVQTMLLAARARGLATCWMTGPTSREAEISALCGMEGSKLVAVVPMGYPDEQPKPPPRQPDRVTYVGV